MTDHDLVAELNGYRNELASAERWRRTERAEAVRAEVERVTSAIRARVAILAATGAESPELAHLRAAVPDLPEAEQEEDTEVADDQKQPDEAAAPATAGPQETAAPTAPRERAVPARKGK